MLEHPEKVEELYQHPLIKSLAQPLTAANEKVLEELSEKEKSGKLRIVGKFRKWQLERKQNSKPSYIPARNFAFALFDVVANAGTEKSPIRAALNQLQDGIDGMTDENLKQKAKAVTNNIYQLVQVAANSEAGSKFQTGIKKELKKQISLLGAEYGLQALTPPLMDAIDNSTDNLAQLFKNDLVLEQVRAGLSKFGKDEPLGKSLHALLAGAEEYATDADKALAVGRKNIEEWFDNTMDRLGGWYKRWAQVWAFGIGLALAIAFNIDSIRIANTLWKTPELRAATASYVQAYVEKETAQTGFDIKNVDLKPISDNLQQMSYPLGWTGDVPNKLIGWLVKLVGLLITAGAAMQGAPFWFDTLKKLVNVRSTGANPAEKPAGTAPIEREKV